MNTRNFSLLAVAVLLITSSAYAQKKENLLVPEVVQKSFGQRFPNASPVEWRKEDATTYEAEFKLNGTEYSANYSNSGEWLVTEMEVNQTTLPEAVLATLKTDYVGHKVKECERVEKPGGSIVYEVEVVKDDATTEVVLDVNGRVFSTKKISVEEKEIDAEDND